MTSKLDLSRPFLSVFHGPEHWERVAENGRRIAAETPGCDLIVVLLFADLHDRYRIDDGEDPEHGRRAAAALREKPPRWRKLTLSQRLLLDLAISCHADGNASANPTVGACWDADRLDLGRVGITPDPRHMSTEAGRRMADALLRVEFERRLAH